MQDEFEEFSNLNFSNNNEKKKKQEEKLIQDLTNIKINPIPTQKLTLKTSASTKKNTRNKLKDSNIDNNKREIYIKKIILYLSIDATLGNQLKINLEKLHSLTEVELHSLICKIKTFKNSQRIFKNAALIISNLAHAVEGLHRIPLVKNLTRLDLTSFEEFLKNELENDTNLKTAFEEVVVEYSEYFNTPPLLNLGFALYNVMKKCDKFNCEKIEKNTANESNLEQDDETFIKNIKNKLNKN